MSKAGRSIEEIILQRQLEGNQSNNPLDYTHTSSSPFPGYTNGFSIHSQTMQHPPSSIRLNQPSSSMLYSNSTNNLTSSIREKNKKTLLNSSGQHTLNKPASRNAEDENKRIMQALMEHCQNLQNKVQSLESKLIIAENVIDGLRYEREAIKYHSRLHTPALGSQQQALPQSLQLPTTVPPTPSKTVRINAPGDKGNADNLNSTRPASRITNSRQRSRESVSRPGTVPSSAGTTSFDPELNATVGDMDNKILELRNMFTSADPIIERQKAATKISAAIRGWLARLRLADYYDALKSIRWIRASSCISIIESRLDLASKIESKIQSLNVRRESRFCKIVFERWQHLCRQTAPFRRSMHIAAEEKYKARIFKLMLTVFTAFRDGTIGNVSHKQIRKERRMLIETIRNQLLEKREKEGLHGVVVSDREVKKAMYHHIVTIALGIRDSRNKQAIFNIFKTLLQTRRKNMKKAHQKLFRKYAGRCFYAWSDWTYLVGTGLDRKLWTGPRKYEVRYNRRLVEHFSSSRLKRMVFKPWKRYSLRLAEVNRRYMKKESIFVRQNLVAWKVLVEKWKALRKDAFEKWKEYPLLIVKKPFDAWAKYSSSASLRRSQHDTLVNAYVRWKRRQWLVKIMRTWRHQALYGGVEGMYSRTNISKSLGEQKSLCNALQKMLTRQTIELEECKELVTKETDIRKKMEDKSIAKDAELERLRMQNHHLDQELRRLNAIIESMARINPRQVKHLKEMQPDFQFRERKIQPSLDVASDLLDESTKNLINSVSEKIATEPSVTSVGNSTLMTTSMTTANSTLQGVALLSSGGESQVAGEKKEDALPPEDRRLLIRVKWLLDRLYCQLGEYSDRKVSTVEHCLDKSGVKQEKLTEVEKILNDEDLRGEALFCLSILSFLKDGNVQCLNSADRRSYTQALLKSAGRNDSTLANLVAETASAPFVSTVDSDSWRTALLYLRMNYDIGCDDEEDGLGISTGTGLGGNHGKNLRIHQNFHDLRDNSAAGVYSRIETMREELQNVIKYRTEKGHHSKFGQKLQSSLALQGYGDENGMMSTDIFQGVNMYASNLTAQIADGGVNSDAGAGTEFNDEEEEVDEKHFVDPFENVSVISERSALSKFGGDIGSAFPK